MKVSPGLVKSGKILIINSIKTKVFIFEIFLATTDFAQYSSNVETSLTNVGKTLLVCGFGHFDNQRNRYVEPQCTEMYIKNPEFCSLKPNQNLLCGYWMNKDNNGKVFLMIFHCCFNVDFFFN